MVFSFDFMPAATGTYTLHIQDENGLPWQYTAELSVAARSLAGRQGGPAGEQQLDGAARCRDRLQLPGRGRSFRRALASIVEYRRKRGRRAGGKARSDCTSSTTARAWDRSAGADGAGRERPAAAPTLGCGPSSSSSPRVWPLRKQFKEGETIAVHVCADDFCDIYGPREPGAQPEIELRIVSKFELDKEIDEKLAEMQQQAVRMQKMQEEAAEAVKEAKARTR